MEGYSGRVAARRPACSIKTLRAETQGGDEKADFGMTCMKFNVPVHIKVVALLAAGIQQRGASGDKEENLHL